MKLIQTVLILSGLTLLTGCNNGNRSLESNGQTNITVAQWGQTNYLIYLPFYVAMEKDFFKEQGLNIHIKYSGNDDQVFAAVLKGDAQFGIGDPIFTAISRERGAKGKVVASIVDGVSVWGITKKNIKEIKRVEDLKGLKIGTFPSPSTVYTLVRNTIDANKSKLPGTDIIQAPIGSGIALLERGSADIAMALEPEASIAEENGFRIVYSMSKFYGPFAFTGVTTTEDYISRNNQIVHKFVNAIEKSLQYIRNNSDSSIMVAQKLFPDTDKKIIAAAVRRMIFDNTFPIHSEITKESWQQAVTIRMQTGDLTNVSKLEDAADTSFFSTSKIQE